MLEIRIIAFIILGFYSTLSVQPDGIPFDLTSVSSAFINPLLSVGVPSSVIGLAVSSAQSLLSSNQESSPGVSMGNVLKVM